MKKILMSMGLMFAALTLTNCSQDINDSVVPTTPAGAEFSITASLDATRTVAEGMSTTWAAEDGMNIMHAVAGAATYTNDGEFAIENVATGQFKGTLGADLESEQSYDWYAIYPYNANISSPASTSKWRQLSYKEQTQEGYGSTAHIVGENGALYGITEGVVNDAAVTFQMHHLTSMLAFNVTNKCEEPFIIQSVAFTAAGKDIAGTFYVDITGDAPNYVSSGDSYTFETITLTVANGEEVAVNGSAMLYMSVVPFAVGTDETLEVVVNTNKGSYTKSLTMTGDVTFAAGKATKLGVNAEFDIENFVVVPVGEGVAAGNNEQKDPISWTFGENDNFTVVANKADASDAPRQDSDGTFRFYKGSTLTFTAKSGAIVKIEATVTNAKEANYTANDGTITTATTSKLVWEGKTQNVVLTNNGTAARFNPIKVYYTDDESGILKASSLSFTQTEIEVDLNGLADDFDFPEPIATLTTDEAHTTGFTLSYSSSNADVATVDGDGKVTINKDATTGTAVITATFAGDENYKGCSAEYTIVVKNSAQSGPVWKKATSVTVGKEYVLVCGSKSMYLTGISTTNTKYGVGSSVTISGDTITSNVADGAILTLEEGSTDGTYSFKMGDKYLTWTSGNSLNTNATKSANTSWKITFDASGNATILNGKDNTRKLQWNASSPRFACYTGAQTAVQLYEKQ